MASRLLDRLKRSLFKDGQGVGPEQEAEGGPEEEAFNRDRWESELEEEECVTERLGGTLRFDDVGGGAEDGAEGDGSGLDSDSDFLGESMEEGLSSTGEVTVHSFNTASSSTYPVEKLICPQMIDEKPPTLGLEEDLLNHNHTTIGGVVMVAIVATI